MKPIWRLFEQVVAGLEKIHGPVDTVVTTPDHLPEKISGRMREVDASIRYKVGSVVGVIVVECRRRGANEDITWLEQLKSKRDSLGASIMIAVSNHGFSTAAVEFAKYHSIELRILRQRLDKQVTCEFFEDGKKVQTLQYDYKDINGKHLGGTSVGILSNGYTCRLTFGQVRNYTESKSIK